MNLPMFSMTAGQIAQSKGMIAGLGLISLGGYMISTGSAEFGFGIIMNGFAILGIRDAQK